MSDITNKSESEESPEEEVSEERKEAEEEKAVEEKFSEEEGKAKKKFSFEFPKKITKKQARNATLKLTFTALFTALVIVATFYIQIPTGVGGYANLGDAVIFMCALTMGGIPALIAGGIGSMAADLILGYAAYAPFTLVIKGVEGLIAGLLVRLVEKLVKKKPLKIGFQIGSLVVAALWMVLGYFLVKWLILKDLDYTAIVAALMEVPYNLAQGGISVAIAAVLVFVKGLAPKGLAGSKD